MKNLEQIRAANALAYADAGVNTRGTKGGDVVKKLPALIMSNGLLAAAAFAYAKGQEDGWYVCFDYLAAHLSHKEVEVTAAGKNNLRALLDHLSKEADSNTLKEATAESLAWLCFAARFVKKPKDDDKSKPEGASR